MSASESLPVFIFIKYSVVVNNQQSVYSGQSCYSPLCSEWDSASIGLVTYCRYSQESDTPYLFIIYLGLGQFGSIVVIF